MFVMPCLDLCSLGPVQMRNHEILGRKHVTVTYEHDTLTCKGILRI